jgi:hypothetical protein
LGPLAEGAEPLLTGVTMSRNPWTPLEGFIALVVALAPAGFSARASFAQAVDQNLWVANGSVDAIARSGNTLYIGGLFNQVGPATGAGVPINAATGVPVPGFPKVAGIVRAVAPDGSGGWFIGGFFSAVGGIPRANLAHILADNSVAAWNPGANDGVIALVVSGSLVYVGGVFTNVGGQPRNRIAALDASTGLPTAWDPNASGGLSLPPTSVVALAVSGTTVYAGGNLTTIGGQTRNCIAALDAATGLATSWNPNASGWDFPGSSVQALAVSGTTVYAGGFFTTIGGQTRNAIAALDATSGLATTWNPNATGTVSALAVSGGIVYVGGDFTRIGGMGRAYIAALNATTGSATFWNPAASSAVWSLVVNGTIVYAGGAFGTIGGQSRSGIAALDVGTGLATAWNPNANNQVYALGVSGSTVYAGGTFSGLGQQTRNRLAALDVTSGHLLGWNPNASNAVSALVVSGGTVYVGGSFTAVGGQTRNYIAALDGASGLATGWNPNSNGFVNALVVSGGTVYAGGQFTSIGQQTRNRIAALDPGSGFATGWDPNSSNTVRALAVSGTTVYAGGDFTTIGGQTRNRIAALDAGTGLATGWDPNAGSYVDALATDGSTVYAGGLFTTIGGQTRNRIAALDAGTGFATAWDPNANNIVRALAVSGPRVYVGGEFTAIGGQARNRVAALDASSGLAAAWNPNANGNVTSLLTSSATVYTGGFFSGVGLWPQARIAAIAASPAASAIVPSTGGNDGPEMVSVVGSGLPTGAAVKLARSGQADISGTGVSVAADGNSLTATFDLTAALAGSWDVVVTTPDLQTATLLAGFTVESVIGVGERPLAFGLEKIWPNPNSGPVTVTYSLPRLARVRLGLYDLAGRRLIALVDGERPAGRHTAIWDARDRGARAAPGVYFVRFETPVGNWVRRFALTR